MNLNIKNFPVMYLAASIGSQMDLSQEFLNVSNYKDIINVNYILYNIIISHFGGVIHYKVPDKFEKELKNNNYYINLIELIYKNLNDKSENDYKKIINLIGEDIKNTKKSDTYLNSISLNTINLFQNKKEFNKKDYYSLLFMVIPFGLKISDKSKLILEISKFVELLTNDYNHILSCITIGLFINYAINKIGINIWLDKIIEDLIKIKGSEKYIDYINNYIENNFRNGVFVAKRIDEFVVERNNNFIINYGSKSNAYLTVKGEEQVLLIFDSLIRSQDNWEKLVLFGITNYNDNISFGIILGILYELMYSSGKINNNLIKRFSFNL